MYKRKKYFTVFFLAFFLLIGFTRNRAYAITQASEELYNGIDVSSWQGYIDYSKVKEAGIDIVYIKSSEGHRTKDPYFETNYENAKANGLNVGFYHFVTATNEEEASNQAKFFASVIAGKSPDCKLAMDYEEFNGVGTYEINYIAQVFLETVKNLTGKDVIVYSDLSNAQSTFNSQIAQNYELWIAYYGSIEHLKRDSSSWNYWVGMQYEDNGQISGINGNVDRDLFTKEIFLQNEDKKIPETNKTYPENTRTFIYIVQSGNTLWQISREYNTTIQEIADLNNIQNVNLIFPGQRLKIIENSNIHGSVYNNIGSKIYVVKPGDCLYNIAQEFGVTVNQLVELNNIPDPNLIYPGQRLRIR